MLEPLLLPSGALLKLGEAELLPERVTVDVHTTASGVVCPSCQSAASRVHSHYQRTLADLPLAHIPVQFHIRLRSRRQPRNRYRPARHHQQEKGIRLPGRQR